MILPSCSLGVKLLKRPVLAALLLLVLLTALSSVDLARAETKTLVDSTVEVANLGYYTITRDIDIEGLSNVAITGTLDVSDGTINLYIMDPTAYQSFQKSNQPDSTLYREDNIRSHSVNMPITASGTYYFVLDNQASFLSSRTVRVQLELSFERTNDTLLMYAGIGVVIVVIAVVAFLVLKRTKKKTGRVASKAAALMSSEAMVPKYCVHCGAVMHQMARTCPACGREQRQ